MIDELAKAICCKSYCQKRIGGQQCFSSFYKDGVENLLRRLREPTPEMKQACLRELSDSTVQDPKAAAWDAQRAFRAMIDAAIGDRK